MKFFSKALFAIFSIPVIEKFITHLIGLIEFKKDLCIHVRGFRIYSNTLDRILASLMWKYSSLEDYETRLLRKTLREGMTIIDIGANIGYYTLLMGKLVGKDGTVYAFEPEKNNYRLLEKNILINKIPNIIPTQKAAANGEGTVRLFISKGHRGDHRIYVSDD
ncbi:unnamed protein product, partial [marine sediment metagenome]